MNGKAAPGRSVVNLGACPIGLAALLTARFHSPAQSIMIDLDGNRPKVTQSSVRPRRSAARTEKGVAAVAELTQTFDADTVIKTAGAPATFMHCQQLVFLGGAIADVGVYGRTVDLYLEKLWDRS